MLRKTIFCLTLGLVALLIIPASPASAGMNWDAGLYLWAMGIDGSTRVRGQDAEIDLSFTDIAQNLDMAAMVHFEGTQEEPGWGFFVDVFWADLSQDLDQPLDELGFQMSLLEGAITYALDENLQFFAGARYTSMDMSLSFDFNLPGPGILPLPDKVSGSESWTDLMVGGRVHSDVGDKWAFQARFDLAGFGLSNSSHFTWNLAVLGQRRFGSKWSFVFGYRAMDIDYRDSDSGFVFDGTLAGPVLAGTYSF